jgi:sensor c-di-GMP phosphodiesterase-like protein
VSWVSQLLECTIQVWLQRTLPRAAFAWPRARAVSTTRCWRPPSVSAPWLLDRVTLAGEIKSAIDKHEFELQYQPQVELSSQNIVDMEALVRWNHPTRGLLAPAVFILIAEKSGAIIALGHWILDQACRQMSIWRKSGLTLPLIAINLSLF